MEPRRIVPMDSSFFECSFCSKRLKPPTFKCDAGHVVCQGCCAGHHLFCTRTCIPSHDVDRAVCVAMGSCAHEERGCKRRVRDEDQASATHAAASRATKASASANGNGNAAPGTRARRGVKDLQGLYPSLALAVDGITNDADESLRPMLMRAFQRISDQRTRELDAKMKKQVAEEAQMTMKQTALRNQVLDLLICRSSSDEDGHGASSETTE